MWGLRANLGLCGDCEVLWGNCGGLEEPWGSVMSGRNPVVVWGLEGALGQCGDWEDSCSSVGMGVTMGQCGD